jgi:hypothetical protein
MTGSSPNEPAEARLDEHLELLRATPPEPSTELTARVVRAARWQRAIRRPLVVAAQLASAALDGLGILMRTRSRRR